MDQTAFYPLAMMAVETGTDEGRAVLQEEAQTRSGKGTARRT